MTSIEWLLAGVEAVCWYAFIYFLIISIKHDVSVMVYAGIITFFLYGAVLSSPLVHATQAWKNLVNKH